MPRQITVPGKPERFTDDPIIYAKEYKLKPGMPAHWADNRVGVFQLKVRDGANPTNYQVPNNSFEAGYSFQQEPVFPKAPAKREAWELAVIEFIENDEGSRVRLDDARDVWASEARFRMPFANLDVPDDFPMPRFRTQTSFRDYYKAAIDSWKGAPGDEYRASQIEQTDQYGPQNYVLSPTKVQVWGSDGPWEFMPNIEDFPSYWPHYARQLLAGPQFDQQDPVPMPPVGKNANLREYVNYARGLMLEAQGRREQAEFAEKLASTPFPKLQMAENIDELKQVGGAKFHVKKVPAEVEKFEPQFAQSPFKPQYVAAPEFWYTPDEGKIRLDDYRDAWQSAARELMNRKYYNVPKNFPMPSVKGKANFRQYLDSATLAWAGPEGQAFRADFLKNQRPDDASGLLGLSVQNAGLQSGDIYYQARQRMLLEASPAQQGQVYRAPDFGINADPRLGGYATWQNDKSQVFEFHPS
ncbi:MAG: hypothetical protein KF874_11990 [Rhizobiaceae bacterium]|nr:hypothetical protein [Rhizobiaceae bacterium]